MTRSLARIALVAALMVGVIAMHSFGHRGHTEKSEFGAESAVVTVHHHMAHGPGGHDAATELDAGEVAPAQGSVAAVAMHGSDQIAAQSESAEGSPRHGSAATAPQRNPAESALSHDSDEAAPAHDSSPEHNPLHALSMLGFMICGTVLLRVAFEVLRKFWPRLLEILAALTALPAFRAALTRFRYPPPLLRPTSLLLNRIAVLRI